MNKKIISIIILIVLLFGGYTTTLQGFYFEIDNLKENNEQEISNDDNDVYDDDNTINYSSKPSNKVISKKINIKKTGNPLLIHRKNNIIINNLKNIKLNQYITKINIARSTKIYYTNLTGIVKLII